LRALFKQKLERCSSKINWKKGNLVVVDEKMTWAWAHFGLWMGRENRSNEKTIGMKLATNESERGLNRNKVHLV
jgi:hypothetical protein